MGKSLFIQLISHMTALIVVVLGIMIFFLLNDVGNRFDQFRNHQLMEQAKTLANVSKNSIANHDYEMLEQLVAASMPTTDYAYAYVTKPDGKILVHSNLEWVSKQLAPPIANKLNEKIFNTHPVIEAVHAITINQKILGYASVAYYKDNHTEFRRINLFQINIIVITGLIILTLGSLMIIRRMVNPIQRLTEIISLGSSEKPLIIDRHILSRKDEIGALSMAFQGIHAKLFQAYQKSKNDEKALQDSEQQFRQLAEGIDEVIWMRKCRDNEIVYVSPGYETVWDQSRDLLYQKPDDWLSAVHPDDIKYIQAKLKQTRFDIDYRIITKDNTIRWIHHREFPIYNDAGKKYRYVSIANDITYRKNNEKKLKHATIEARQANEAKSVFLANISHEIRTPLNSIIGFTEMMMMEGLSDKQHKFVKITHQSADTILAIVDDILDFSKIEANQCIIDSIKFIPRQLVQNIYDLMSEQAHKKILNSISILMIKYPTN